MDLIKVAGTLRAGVELGERAMGSLREATSGPVTTWYGRTITPAPTIERRAELIRSAVDDAHLAARLVNRHRAPVSQIQVDKLDHWANTYLDDLTSPGFRTDGYSTNDIVLRNVGKDVLGQLRAAEREVIRDARIGQAEIFARELIDELSARMGTNPIDEGLALDTASTAIRAAIG